MRHKKSANDMPITQEELNYVDELERAEREARARGGAAVKKANIKSIISICLASLALVVAITTMLLVLLGENPPISKAPEGVTFEDGYCIVEFNEKGVLTKRQVDRIFSNDDVYYSESVYIKIGEGVTQIGVGAFEGCYNIASVEIPDSVTSIGNDAFAGCTGLTKIEISTSVTSMGERAFMNCTEIKEAHIPAEFVSALKGLAIERLFINGGSAIEANAFSNQRSLKYLEIAEGVTAIGKSAFADCTNLYSAVLPVSITTVGDGCFTGANVKEATAPSNAARCFEDSVEKLTITGDNIENSACSNMTTLKSVEIKGNVESIGQFAFSDCTSLETVAIPESVTTIDRRCFDGCTSLKSVTLPSKLASIGAYAFAECKSIEEIVIPKNVGEIGNHAFYNCTSLESAVLNGGTSIGGYCFTKCTSLKSVTLPDTLKTINVYAFSGCELLNEIFIPISVTEVSIGVFKGNFITTVYCEAPSKPAGWATDWDIDCQKVVWDYKG